MKYTIREIAEECGVTKAAIVRLMDSEFRDKYVSEADGPTGKMFKINQKGHDQLIDHFGKRESTKTSTNKNEKNESVNQDLIEMLKMQLKQKDEQLKAKDKQIEQMQILLSQSQQLQLSATEKVKKLETRLEKKNENKNKDEEIEKQEEKEKVDNKKQQEEKKSFWKKIFG